MKSLTTLSRVHGVVASVALLLLAGTAHAGPLTINIVPSVGPNQFGSPSFDQYAQNAVTGLQNNQTAVGNAASPTYYATSGAILASQMVMVTDFNSWLGQANPTGAF